MSRIGIMGGTFNPIHAAHIAMGKAAYAQANLDKVLFMPSKRPPHKRGGDVAGEEHRAKMVKLAISGIPYFEYSDFEFKRDGMTYSSQTIELLKRQFPMDDFFFIMGADSLLQIEKWREPEKLMRLASILALNRGSVDDDDIALHAAILRDRYDADVKIISMPKMDVSSTKIRKMIAAGEDVGDMVDGGVRDYIDKNGIYKS